MKQLSIGNLKLKSPILLAPMVDVTNLPYRLICREAGASMAYTEMLNLGAILHENKKTKEMMMTCKEDSPLGIQITGSRIEDFRAVVSQLREYDVVDINCGCPSIRTLDNQSGAYLLRNPDKIARYIELLKNEGLTVSAKIRLGFKNNNAIKIAKTIEKSGADALTVHARLSSDSYKTPADLLWIKKIKKEVGIPIIGNGDVFSEEDAEKMLEIADGVMIARGAIGNPLIFERIKYYLKTKKLKERDILKDFRENLRYYKKYIALSRKYSLVNLPQIKSVGVHFIKNVSGSSKMRQELMQKKSIDQIDELTDNFLELSSSKARSA